MLNSYEAFNATSLQYQWYNVDIFMTHHLGPKTLLASTNTQYRSAVSRGMNHAARHVVLTGVLSAFLCRNGGHVVVVLGGFRLLEDLGSVDPTATPWTVVSMHAPWYNSNTKHHNEPEEVGMRKVCIVLPTGHSSRFRDLEISAVCYSHVSSSHVSSSRALLEAMPPRTRRPAHAAPHTPHDAFV